jgi:hypothetical protein
MKIHAIPAFERGQNSTRERERESHWYEGDLNNDSLVALAGIREHFLTASSEVEH